MVSAPMNGWKARIDGWFAHPEYEHWLRSRDGRWWSKADVDEGRVEMTDDGPRIVPGWYLAGRQWVREMTEQETLELRRRLEEVSGE